MLKVKLHMVCKKVTRVDSVCIVPEGNKRYTALLKRKARSGKGFFINEFKDNLTKSQAKKLTAGWTKKVKAAEKKLKKRRTPYP